MTDPLTALRAPITPVDPDPAFAADLRARIERALALPRGVAPMTTTLQSRETRTAAAIPYLAVGDASRALDWYADIFGARVVGEPISMPDGRIGHAELAIGAGVLYLADEHPEIGVAAPRPGEASVSLMLDVDDADAVRDRAMRAGAIGDREPYDAYGTRNAWIVDPFGHRWGLQSPLSATAEVFQHGDIAYISLHTSDSDRARAFYRRVLNWTYDDRGRVADGLPHTGLWTQSGHPTLFCCYAVDDVDDAVARIRASGGQAGEPSNEPHGRIADCADDQGTLFAVWQIGTGPGTPRPLVNGRRHGDLSYLTLEVVDSARARAFYGPLLGWEFTPGRIADGWQVEGPVPMTGISGGHERATAVPMWRVDDVAVAVERVRAAGGTATDPARQPYGVTSECTDDQGSRFYLGEL